MITAKWALGSSRIYSPYSFGFYRKSGAIRTNIKRFSTQTQHEGDKTESTQSQQKVLLQEYKVRSSLERVIHYYAKKPLKDLTMRQLYEQSEKLSPEFIIENARETIDKLLIYNARRLREFRKLPYLVVLNPSISFCYNNYLSTMASLLASSMKMPSSLDENDRFVNGVLKEFLEIHSDTLPTLSKGFGEVINLMNESRIKSFLDVHLKDRICMRLIAHQHEELTGRVLSGQYEKGDMYNGVVKLLDIREVIKKNAALVNDIFLMKYDQQVSIKIDTNNFPLDYHSLKEPLLDPWSIKNRFMYPYIEHHIDYVFTEIFKNSFRAHIENKVNDPVQVTISLPPDSSYLEIRIRDRGKGIPRKVLDKIFDYSFTTYESQEGDSYKTLNVPPGAEGNVVAGMGYGLPLLKSYIEIFNATDASIPAGNRGLLTIQTYPGLGTDVYVKTRAC